jgi:hypothetical protein
MVVVHEGANYEHAGKGDMLCANLVDIHKYDWN